jgi:hypothetical protein
MDVHPHVRIRVPDRGTGVHPHPDADLLVLRPGVGGQPSLR